MSPRHLGIASAADIKARGPVPPPSGDVFGRARTRRPAPRQLHGSSQERSFEATERLTRCGRGRGGCSIGGGGGGGARGGRRGGGAGGGYRFCAGGGPRPGVREGG